MSYFNVVCSTVVQVTRIDEIFEYLLEEEEVAFTRSSLSSRDRVTKVSGVNAILEVNYYVMFAFLNAVMEKVQTCKK